MTPPEQSGSSSNGQTLVTADRATLAVTNAIKLLGAVIIFLEYQGQGRTPVLLVALALAMGTQAVENALLRAIDKFFARE
jgi:hypothetical protein